MTRLAHRAFAFLAALGCCTAFASAGEPDGFSLQWVTVKATVAYDPEPALRFSFRSRRTLAFSMYEADLPWGNSGCLRLEFRRASGQAACPTRTVPIDDASDAQVTVVPAGKLEGTVSLETYCPMLGELLREGPMTLEWAYAPVVVRTDEEPLRGQVSLQTAE